MSLAATASVAVILPPLACDFVPRPFPTNFVLLSIVKVMSLPPELTIREVADTDFTVPEAVIALVDAFFACA